MEQLAASQLSVGFFDAETTMHIIPRFGGLPWGILPNLLRFPT